jgi:uncharacterized protein DUF2344
MTPGTVAEPDPASFAEQGAATAGPPARQRWRLVLARNASTDARAGRELAEAWDAAIDRSGLPVHRAPGKLRARVLFGAPVPAAMALRRELADILLTSFVPRWEVREALEPVLPRGWRLVDLYDVWLGEPPLAGQVAAADYRIELADGDPATVAAAAARLLAAGALPRERAKGGETVRYDLRPLVADLAVADPGPPIVLHARTRFDPALGTGRPEEVMAALGNEAGIGLVVDSIVREQVLLANELD